ncbi:MAG TPA: hypothetical protein EYN69_03180 [Flavobacteriales bacterium]|nr:hypothetical protein [Flavobacteriales bacterium]
MSQGQRITAIPNLFEKLSSNPTESIPGACNKFSETKAAYRFFDHKNVSAEKILAPHINSTISRIQSHKTVLLLQDTTELSYRGGNQKKVVLVPASMMTTKLYFCTHSLQLRLINVH